MENVLMAKWATIMANPVSLAALMGVLFLMMAIIRWRKIALTPRMMAYVGLAIAMTVVLHTFRIYHFPQGGSITLGGMVPILLIAVLYGPEVGCLTGFLYGMINLLLNPYILHPVQVLFDYPLPYMALGLAGYFSERRLTGCILAIAIRYVCHFISGVVFFASYAPAGMSPYLYSAVLNASYLGPELVITLVILRVLPVKRLEGILRRVG